MESNGNRVEAPIPENEFERALKLSDYDIDYSEVNESLDDLTRLAAHIAGTPISLINLLDTNTQWTISNFGMESKQMPREKSVCQYVVLEDEPLEVKDLSSDERFKSKDYVTGDPNLKYYFGVPLISPDGFKLGAMCVLDREERDLSPEKTELLKIIAEEIITRIEYEHRLKQMKQNMEEVSELQRKVSHDIRGPINGIIGLAEILKDQAEENKLEDFMQLLELINKGGRSVLELADEILSNYKESTDGTELPKNRFTLPLFKEKLEDLYGPQAKSKSVSYQVEISDEHQDLNFPRHKLLQIAGNLISNAIKFTPENGLVRVVLDIENNGSRKLIIKVEDNGVGMNSEQVAAILNDKQTSTEGTGKEKGYGIGFRLSKHLVETMKGSVSIDSEPGKGTNVGVTIPIEENSNTGNQPK